MTKNEYLAFFDATYKERLEAHPVFADRYNGFRKIFEELLKNKEREFTIIETGTLRKKNTWTDGQSSLLFFEFMSFFGGTLISIDTDENALETCRAVLDKEVGLAKANFVPIHGNSILELEKITRPANLLYLDSFDLEGLDALPSALHHLKELASAAKIRAQSADLIIAVDDNYKDQRIGKGKFIADWAHGARKEIIHDGFQFVFCS